MWKLRCTGEKIDTSLKYGRTQAAATAADVCRNHNIEKEYVNSLNAELNPICHLLALLGVHFLHVSRIRVKSLTP